MRLKVIFILALLMVITGVICKKNEPRTNTVEVVTVQDTIYVETREPIDTVLYLN